MHQSPSNKSLNDIKQMAGQLNQEQISYFYRGKFSQEVVVDILSMVESTLLGKDCRSLTKKKVYNLLVECMQNISRHQAPSDRPELQNVAMVALQQRSDRYLITTGNLIKNNEIERVEQKIDEINQASDYHLKDVFKKQLISGHISRRGGAGLGMLDMARKSHSWLYHRIERIDDELSFFYFKIEVDSNKLNAGHRVEHKPDTLKKMARLHKTIVEQDISLIYNHHLSPRQAPILLKHLKSQLHVQMTTRNHAYHVADYLFTTLAKNNKHNKAYPKLPFMFVIHNHANELVISSGMELRNESVDENKQQLQTTQAIIKNPQAKVPMNGFNRKKLTVIKRLDYTVTPKDKQFSFLSIRIAI